jgi:hypothetical protein
VPTVGEIDLGQAIDEQYGILRRLSIRRALCGISLLLNRGKDHKKSQLALVGGWRKNVCD